MSSHTKPTKQHDNEFGGQTGQRWWLLFNTWFLTSIIISYTAWMVTNTIFDLSGSRNWGLYLGGVYVIAALLNYIWVLIVGMRAMKRYSKLDRTSIGHLCCANCRHPYDTQAEPTRCPYCGADLEAANSLLDLRRWTMTLAIVYDKISILAFPTFAAAGIVFFIPALWNIISLARTGKPFWP